MAEFDCDGYKLIKIFPERGKSIDLYVSDEQAKILHALLEKNLEDYVVNLYDDKGKVIQ